MKNISYPNEITEVNVAQETHGITGRLEVISWYFGLLFSVLFIFQAVTGILLGLYYKSYPQLAFESVLHINGQVAMGWFVKSLHLYTSYFVTASIIIFVLTFFFSGAFSGGKKIFWYSGLLFLIATFGFLASAQLLPWDESSYYSTVRSVELISAALPFGEGISFFLVGGEKLSGVSLARFHSIHISLLPVVCLFVFIFICIKMNRNFRNAAAEIGGNIDSSFFMNSDFRVKFVLLAGLSIATITILSVTIPWSPGIRMDEMISQPQFSAPGWFLLFASGAQKIFPLYSIKLILTFLLVFLIAAPYVVSKSKGNGVKRIFVITGVAFVIALIIFTVIGVIQ